MIQNTFYSEDARMKEMSADDVDQIDPFCDW